MGTANLLRLLYRPPRFRLRRRKLVVFAIGLLLLVQAVAASSAAALRLHQVGRFAQPVYVTAPREESRRWFVLERAGRVKVVQRGRKLRRAFLDIRRIVDLRFPDNQFRDQGGLLSMAFSPDYRRSRLFYLLYTHRDGTIHLDEFSSRGAATRASASSRRMVLSLPHRGRTDLGGHVEFGPDGFLYVGLGYGHDPDSSQDLGTLAGKILRIDPRVAGGLPYNVPADNPFVNRAGIRPEIVAYGLRNPWRFSFDPASGDLVLADVGDERFEEVNLLSLADWGWNLGWPIYEGPRRHGEGSAAGLTFPVLALPHANGYCAIVGGYVIRGRRLPSLRGRYIFGDVCSGRLRSARLGASGGRASRSERLVVSYLDSFGRDGRGRLYALSLLGPVYRISR